MPPHKKDKNVVVKTDAEPKKRERKSTKHQVVAIVTQDGIQGSFQSEIRRPLIAHLPIHSNEIKFYDQPAQYDPTPPTNPVAYEDSMTNPFASLNTYENQFSSNKEDAPPVQQVAPVSKPVAETVKYPQNEYGPKVLLVQYANSKDTKNLPDSTNVACFWCCETFESRPCVVPTEIIDGVWQVYGNFCTPHCASAYLLADSLDTHVRWERLALIHRLYAKYCGGRIYPAPHRECLERFGGSVKTNDFRRLCEERKIRIDIHLPPMVSILASMDTKPVDFYETSLRNTTTVYNPIPTHDSGLKLKRSKPLKDRESTLDACLNIQIAATE